jgi:hypothetical protein
MPLDDGCRFDQYHGGVENLRPNPVKPRPKQPIDGEEPKPAGGQVPGRRDHLAVVTLAAIVLRIR